MRTHNDGLNRRSFLTRSTALLGGLPLLSSQTASASLAEGRQAADLHLYCDESGILGVDVLFVLGMVVTTDSVRHEAAVDRLRQDHHFATQLQYNSTDRFKRPFAEDAIRYFFEEPDLSFVAYAITDKAVTSLRSRGFSLEQVYHHYYETLISNCTPPGVPKTLNLEIRNSIGDDRTLRRYLRENVVNLSKINVAGSSVSNLLQIADLFTGSINGDAHIDSLRNPVKREVLSLLRARANVASLLDAGLEDRRGPFNVYVL
jgi:hypothetical protein